MRVAETGAPETLRLEDVRKSYNIGTPTEIEVLHGIDLILRHGEFAALIGPSGGGKSTLLNVVGLLDQPDGGRIFIAGQQMGALDDAERTRLRGRSIGFVFQYHYLLPAFTAIENVMMPVLAARGRPDDEMRDNAAALLDKVGLTPWRDNMSTDISGGQQQRVAVARALVNNPAILLADEPTGALDSKTGAEIIGLFQRLHKDSGQTVIYVTHDPFIARHTNRVVRIADGLIVGDEVIEHPLAAGTPRPSEQALTDNAAAQSEAPAAMTTPAAGPPTASTPA
jgi:lipoprotein-releasing system ATP-binding protein